ncbi:MAG: hypothetical protein OXD31_19120 [Chloroflexi bacterium]|nr:hypothetical protein [Chloroflexota bacterium]
MNDLDIAAGFAVLHGLGRVRTRQIGRGALEQWVDDHEDMLLSLEYRQEGALRKFERPDYLAMVGERRAGRMERAFYLAVESPYAVRERDIDKVTDNAKILRAVTGLAAYPVVAAGNLDPMLSDGARARLYEDVAGYVAAGDTDAALWYRLDPEAD